MTTTWVALLRAVNVGGRTVKMERLRELFADVGLVDVRSYIQSGNVFFTDPAGLDRAELGRRIEAHLAEALGWPVPVLLRTVEELAAVVEADPFRGVEVTPDVRLLVAFLTEPPPADLELPARTKRGDVEVIAVTDAEAFAVGRIIDGRPVGKLEPVLGKGWPGQVTARFFHTTVKILAAARKG
ncbi:DUF1697 domain-containing protein [Kitasatospora viridis]|uniref:Uncharacterized protein (DUF1697 family) n=1 Tax=Kitasatospora viridis TaxID=281105 RepID=A0A561ULU6_9ACTN|nr:DUF1697 domain-containing protein [Kitasatospora viridis]TWG00358.1 uncharacterized protein (DUF1697 family) [Kitasatospora viridis]